MLKPHRSIVGFSLIELIVTITVFSIVALVGIPVLGSWVSNAQVRTVADGLLNGLHLAQAEAARRNRQVQFILTTNAPNNGTSFTASGTGTNWVIVTVPRISDSTGTLESVERIQGNSLTNVASSVTVSGPSTLTFNSYGYVSNGAALNTYNVAKTGADHPLNVVVTVGGQLRVCDPNKALTASPEGCT